MKAIISLFISAYRGNMASAECQPNSLYFSHQAWECGYPSEPGGFTVPSYEELFWAISRASKCETLGYCITYLRYVRYHVAYAKAVERAWLKRQIQEAERFVEEGQHQLHMQQELATSHQHSASSLVPTSQQ